MKSINENSLACTSRGIYHHYLHHITSFDIIITASFFQSFTKQIAHMATVLLLMLV
jgi:hypothetical protein